MVRIAAYLSVALLVGCNSIPTGSDRTDKDKIKVGELLDVVKQAAKDAQADIAADQNARLPPLATVSLVMQAKETKGGSASADFFIVSGQVKGEDAATQIISVKLTAPPPGPKILSTNGDVYENVVNAIRAASIAANQAFSANPKDLQLQSVGATVAFDVSRTVSGGLKLDLGVVKIGPGASYAVSSSHKIDLVFERPK